MNDWDDLTVEQQRYKRYREETERRNSPLGLMLVMVAATVVVGMILAAVLPLAAG